MLTKVKKKLMKLSVWWCNKDLLALFQRDLIDYSTYQHIKELRDNVKEVVYFISIIILIISILLTFTGLEM